MIRNTKKSVYRTATGRSELPAARRPLSRPAPAQSASPHHTSWTCSSPSFSRSRLAGSPTLGRSSSIPAGCNSSCLPTSLTSAPPTRQHTRHQMARTVQSHLRIESCTPAVTRSGRAGDYQLHVNAHAQAQKSGARRTPKSGQSPVNRSPRLVKVRNVNAGIKDSRQSQGTP